MQRKPEHGRRCRAPKLAAAQDAQCVAGFSTRVEEPHGVSRLHALEDARAEVLELHVGVEEEKGE